MYANTWVLCDDHGVGFPIEMKIGDRNGIEDFTLDEIMSAAQGIMQLVDPLNELDADLILAQVKASFEDEYATADSRTERFFKKHPTFLNDAAAQLVLYATTVWFKIPNCDRKVGLYVSTWPSSEGCREIYTRESDSTQWTRIPR